MVQTLPTALSLESEVGMEQEEEGEIKDDANTSATEEPTTKAMASKTAKKVLVFAGIHCPSEAQIEWKPSSANRVIFWDFAEMA